MLSQTSRSCKAESKLQRLRAIHNPFSQPTYHFQVDRNHFYSVPYQHIGRKAKVIYDAETVEVWIGG